MPDQPDDASMPRGSRSALRWYGHRVRDTLRYEGAVAFLCRVLAKSLRPCASVGLVRLYRKDLRDALIDLPPPTGVTVSTATEADTDQLVEAVARYENPLGQAGTALKLSIRARLLDRFRRGWRCFVARAGAEIVHYNWIAFDWADTIEPGFHRFIALRDGEAFCLDGCTAEGWRGRGIHRAVNRAMLAFLQERGYRTAYTNAALQNRPAWTGLERLGWELSGVMLYLRRRGGKRARVWRVLGAVDPFASEENPSGGDPPSTGHRVADTPFEASGPATPDLTVR
jgi:GNAT superfamily N-acetyltransferase